MNEAQSGKKLQFWLGMLVSVACLAAIFIVIDPREIWLALQDAHLGYLVLSTVGILSFMAIRAVRWRFMLNNTVPWGQVFHIQNIGYMLTYLLPFRLGDLARAVLIGNVPPVTLPQGLSTMVVERVLDLLFIVTLLPFTLVAVPSLPPQVQTAARGAGILGLAAIIILIIAANQRPLAQRISTWVFNRIRFMNTEAWVRRVDELLEGLSSLTRWRDGALLVMLSILVWLPILAAYYWGMQAVNIQPTWAMTGFVVCAAALSVAAPSSPGQVGVFHAGVTFALAEILGQPHGQAASFAFLYHALNFVVIVTLGLIGIPRIGATFSNVVATTRAMMTRPKTTA
ncbi:MAG: flippase-like domain-containing protein [Anaerolineales bacterium]|nr:flippase-like domain-containing protein [Anaerolineales bacterium]